MSKNSAYPILRELISGVWGIESAAANALLPRAAKLLSGESNEVASVEAKPVSTIQFSSNGSQESFIAAIEFDDVIIKNSGWCTEGTTSKANRIIAAANDPKCKGIVLSIDSPGGSVNAVDIPTDAIRYAKTKKPVIAHVSSGIAASAAYWIASQADEIYTNFENDMVGSIGTFFTFADFKGYWEKEGIKVTEIYATKSTEKNIEFREAKEGKFDKMTAWIDHYNDHFHAIVKQGRPDAKEEVFKGGMFFTAQAIEMGLIDGMKSLDEVIDRIDELASTNNYDNSTTMIFGKKKPAEAKTEHALAALQALANTPSADRTEEQFSAAQEELTNAEIGAVITNDAGQNEAMQSLIGRSEEIATAEQQASDALAAAQTYLGEESPRATVADAMTAVIKKATSAAPIESPKPESAAEEVNEKSVDVSQFAHNKKADQL